MSARVLDCPQCGAPVNFRSSITVFAVCEHCRSMIVLRGADAELLGIMATLPADLSPFQIGTRGVWQGRGFEIIGRIRVEWEQGSWNEWCVNYDGHTTGWLAEAQGLLMISFPRAVAEELPVQTSAYTARHQVTLDGRVWTVIDRKVVTYRASEGELPFAAPPAQTGLSADLTDGKGGFASVELTEEGAELYLGEYTRFEDLQLTNLRPVPGWSGDVAQEKNRTTALACPACGAPVELRALGQSMAAVCGSCGSVIDTATPEFKIIQTADAAIRKMAPKLPIGQRGKLLGTDYEVIGLLQRLGGGAKWSEYLLFNPWRGFRWLVFYDGHWTLVDRLPITRRVSGKQLTFNGQTYKLFAEGNSAVTGVLGEFYWKVERGERANFSDYVNPPAILSIEVYPELEEITWSHGVYVERGVIAEAFKIKDLPRSSGVYLNQPNKFARRWKEVRVVVVLALLSLLFVQASSFVFQQEAVLTDASFEFVRKPTAPSSTTGLALAPTPSPPAGDSQNSLVTPRFNLQGGEQRVTIEATAPLDNEWLGLDLDLVNTKTNASTPAALELSYYSGYDSDGPWTEGSRKGRVSLPGVPPGEYFVVVEPSAAASLSHIPFTIQVRGGGVFNSNFVLMLVLVLLYPAYLFWRASQFEKARWTESDFDP